MPTKKSLKTAANKSAASPTAKRRVVSAAVVEAGLVTASQIANVQAGRAPDAPKKTTLSKAVVAAGALKSIRLLLNPRDTRKAASSTRKQARRYEMALKLCTQLEAGEFERKNRAGETVTRYIDASASLHRIVRLLKLGASHHCVPTAVVKRFPWSDIREHVLAFATAKGMAPKQIAMALNIDDAASA